jgi:hypothetical protein
MLRDHITTQVQEQIVEAEGKGLEDEEIIC